ncbi:MAG: thiamine pyrophosphate-dependent enzyme [Dehalococcoidia bacterium]|nr:thiamine pyrophosphate-dependent enzyme [Dehalococcoidia bacterium]
MAEQASSAGPIAEPSADVLRDIHHRMVRIRTFEEEAGKLMESSKIPGALHLYVGEEAVACGVMVHLRDEDQITSTHRGHGHLVAKGGDLSRMYAELFGKADGYCKGKGGSMHISDLELGMLGANGIVGAGPPIAVGAAFSNKYRGTDNVTVCFFGDGASNEGSFHEAANMAALYKLPCIFLCENNGFGEYTSQERHQAIRDVADRAQGYGMPGVVVDGMDAVAVYEAAGEAINRARRGEGPTLLEAKTYRFLDHVGVRGMGVVYRDDSEVIEWQKRDPIQLMEGRLEENGRDVAGRDQPGPRAGVVRGAGGHRLRGGGRGAGSFDAARRRVHGSRRCAMTTAEASTGREMTYVGAIGEAMAQMMREDPNVFLAGEDVALYGGVFGSSRGLLDQFGPERVIDSPISEAGLIGLGVGSAATGLRPIIEIMFIDFMGECMDEIVNQAAKMKYMFGGKARLPLTIRSPAAG